MGDGAGVGLGVLVGVVVRVGNGVGVEVGTNVGTGILVGVGVGVGAGVSVGVGVGAGVNGNVVVGVGPGWAHAVPIIARRRSSPRMKYPFRALSIQARVPGPIARAHSSRHPPPAVNFPELAHPMRPMRKAPSESHSSRINGAVENNEGETRESFPFLLMRCGLVLEGQYPVVLRHQVCQVGRAYELGIFTDQILVGYPAGAGSMPSDIYRGLVCYDPGHYLTQYWESHARHVVRNAVLHQDDALDQEGYRRLRGPPPWRRRLL